MSRVAKQPISLPKGVEVKLDGQVIKITGKHGELTHTIHALVAAQIENGNVIQFSAREETKESNMLAGTNRALVNNMVKGVNEIFSRTLQLVGVGFRAQAQGTRLNLTLGFSHPVVYTLPNGVSVETPDQTTIILKSCDKQSLGQVAAEIRAKRPPEPYKGKGIRYSDEKIIRKETKKK